MYYRRKIILSILQIFNKKVSHIYFQKFNFLFSELQPNRNYHFVPYKYGCYSFQIESDLKTMMKYNLLEDKKGYRLLSKEDYISQLEKNDIQILKDIHIMFKNFSSDQITNYVYSKYSYYSLNSEIKEIYLDKNTINNLNYTYRKKNKLLFTIGYEGISIDEYLNKLVKNNIKILCDVRKNPISMKYGFSKNQLKNYCSKLGIEYIHFPELGIDSSKRKNLKKIEDYELLFENYKIETLPFKRDYLIKIIELIRNYKRVALTCFESNHRECHRSRVSEELENFKKWNYTVKHL